MVKMTKVLHVDWTIIPRQEHYPQTNVALFKLSIQRLDCMLGG